MSVRRYFWIFLLALLLPAAQVAAAAHELSHVCPAVEAGSKSGLAGGHCDICALAAQVEGGATPGAAAKAPPLELRQGAPFWHFASRLSAGASAPFDSRAPPTPSV